LPKKTFSLAKDKVQKIQKQTMAQKIKGPQKVKRGKVVHLFFLFLIVNERFVFLVSLEQFPSKFFSQI
jgi:hypothetical protein